jgi:hypothetical protein
MVLSSGFDEPFGNLASNDEINNIEELPNDISDFLLTNQPPTLVEPFVNQDVSNENQHFPSEFDFLEEPSVVLGSNDDLDKSLDDLFGEITSLKNNVPSEQPEDIAANQTQEQSDSSLYATSKEISFTSSSSDPLRGTARTPGSISKAAKRMPPITNYVLEEILPTDSEAEKRRKRVRNCRAKKRAEDVNKEARMNDLVSDNTRMERNIAQLEQELKQFQQIVAAHIGAQPGAAALLSIFQ